VDGGFPEPALPPACTTPEGCRGANIAQPSLYGAPASQTFNGVGNLSPTRAKPRKETKSRRKSACLRKRKRRGRAACQAKHAKRGRRQHRAVSRKGGK
jgi:hypothetical protein